MNKLYLAEYNKIHAHYWMLTHFVYFKWNICGFAADIALIGLYVLNRMLLGFASFYGSCIVLYVSATGFPAPPNNNDKFNVIRLQVASFRAWILLRLSNLT